MAIDFQFSQEVEDARLMMREFLQNTVKKEFEILRNRGDASGDDWSVLVKELRSRAKSEGFWLPHMPQDVGGMGLGITAVAAVSAEAARCRWDRTSLIARHPMKAICIRFIILRRTISVKLFSSHC